MARKPLMHNYIYFETLEVGFDIEFASSSVFGFVRGETLDEWRGVYRVRPPGRADTLSISMCRQTAIVPWNKGRRCILLGESSALLPRRLPINVLKS
jgi:hypothetical protein